MNEITKFIKQNLWALSVQLVGVLVLLANLWLASKLSPLVSRLNTLEVRADAVETDLSDDELKFERLIIVETKVDTLSEQVGRIENKLDRVIESR